jgi:hypothetical protein
MAGEDLMLRTVRLREALWAKAAAELVSLQKRILPELCGRLWHTTHPDRFKSILMSGAILQEPNIPDEERYCTGGGKEHYPYVRTLGGVSLFDFYKFDPDDFDDANPDAYAKRCPSSTWGTFVPYRTDWGCSVWIEIDRERVASQFISGSDLLAKWKSDSAYGHNIMPEIEAAHLGPISCTAFKRVLLVRKNDNEFRHLSIDTFSI